MTIDEVIAAQEANEADVMNARVTLTQFKARQDALAKLESIAMIAIMQRIARRC